MSEETEVKKVVNLSVSFDRGLETYPKMSVDEAIETLTDYGTKYAVVEKTVIPKEVGERIEREIKLISLYQSLNYAYNYAGVGEVERKLDEWVIENTEEYVQAWLNGFTVEKHPILLAKIKGWEQFVDFVGAIYWGADAYTDRLTFVDRDRALAITKKDWEHLGITEDNADFVKVEELEK